MRGTWLSALVLGLVVELAGTPARAQFQDACPGTDLGTLSHLGGTLAGDTTGLSNDFGDTQIFGPNNAPVTDGSDPSIENCDTGLWRSGSSGPDAIASFQVDFAGTWTFSTCPGFPNCRGCDPGSADFDTSLMILKDAGWGCPGENTSEQ